MKKLLAGLLTLVSFSGYAGSETFEISSVPCQAFSIVDENDGLRRLRIGYDFETKGHISKFSIWGTTIKAPSSGHADVFIGMESHLYVSADSGFGNENMPFSLNLYGACKNGKWVKLNKVPLRTTCLRNSCVLDQYVSLDELL